MKTEELQLIAETMKGWHVIRLAGYLQVSNIRKLRTHFEEIEKKRITKVALDLSEVLGVDSSALGLIANFSKRLQKSAGRLCLFAPSVDVESILHMISFEKTAVLYTNREEFLRNEGI